MKRHANSPSVDTLKRKFETEGLELIAIAQAAGDSKTQAIKWAANDTEIQKLFDRITDAGGFAE